MVVDVHSTKHLFEDIKEVIDGRGVDALMIRCRECLRTDKIVKGPGRKIAHGAAAVTFQRRGWHVGSLRSMHRCAACRPIPDPSFVHPAGRAIADAARSIVDRLEHDPATRDALWRAIDSKEKVMAHDAHPPR